jgi:D-glycero-D-manno-heptose 1,7-bisphosphate phosphatase
VIMRRAVFLDRDGTIIVDEGYLADPSKVRWLAGARDALRMLRERGFLLVVVSNQSGVARGLITEEQHAQVDARVKAMLASEGVPLDAAYYCTHAPDAGCGCRKPQPGMLEQAAHEHSIDLTRSFMVGDKLSDIAAGHAAGCITALLGPGKDAPTTADPEAPQPRYRADDWGALVASWGDAVRANG